MLAPVRAPEPTIGDLIALRAYMSKRYPNGEYVAVHSTVKDIGKFLSNMQIHHEPVQLPEINELCGRQAWFRSQENLFAAKKAMESWKAFSNAGKGTPDVKARVINYILDHAVGGMYAGEAVPAGTKKTSHGRRGWAVRKLPPLPKDWDGPGAMTTVITLFANANPHLQATLREMARVGTALLHRQRGVIAPYGGMFPAIVAVGDRTWRDFQGRNHNGMVLMWLGQWFLENQDHTVPTAKGVRKGFPEDVPVHRAPPKRKIDALEAKPLAKRPRHPAAAIQPTPLSSFCKKCKKQGVNAMNTWGNTTRASGQAKIMAALCTICGHNQSVP